MLDFCTHAFDPGEDRQLHIEKDEVVPLDEEVRKTILETTSRLNAQGMRVLLLAIREFSADHPLNYDVEDESNLILTGFIVFLDPAKPSAEPSIAALRKMNVDVKVLTGDNEIDTKKKGDDESTQVQNIMMGLEVENNSYEESIDHINDTSIFAKMST